MLSSPVVISFHVLQMASKTGRTWLDCKKPSLADEFLSLAVKVRGIESWSLHSHKGNVCLVKENLHQIFQLTGETGVIVPCCNVKFPAKYKQQLVKIFSEL